MQLVKEERTGAAISIVTANSEVDPEDDWAGMGDRKERRRRQNRLNQRAYRKRKQATRQTQTQPPNQVIRRTVKTEEPTSSSDEQMITVLSPSTSSPNSTTSPSTSASSSSTSFSFSFSTRPPSQSQTRSSTSTSTSTSSSPRPDRKPCTDLTTQRHLQTLLTDFTRVAYASYIHGSPTLDHLLTLSRMNVYRAFATNMATLGMGTGAEWMHDDALSVFTTLQPHSALDPTALPLHLRPTKLQQTVPHHPWLDFFPLPRLRDNLVAMADRFDDEELCLDIMGFWDSPTHTYSLLVWGEPSDPGNWEITEDFLRKWPWVVRGCAELLASTNRWRARRGEKLLLRYL
ncbi:DUF3425 domain-containing protein [Aspergillus brunneoviolaceus CBS 621.78]|uniref:Uncharacterized protein n=1 Tax=Aspergillus brunneoviolaceus CBS 621.78 TaxID=1450534 RepID=A0ACD1G320_9EURO|nr:hypothetical protein BO95DRAFT_445006 [Aspergillus brunneoviolaceus CBS 621.78]RAH43622.1 hypothetical protein BO95DRAFT_445006 [Aspergillus brunneoviolaceus CBS 621.78]